MSDLISRKAAIDAVNSLTYPSSLVDVKYKLIELPSAQPEQKVGKWIKLYAGNYKCSVCGDWWGNDNNEMVEDFNYCPNCGARMVTE